MRKAIGAMRAAGSGWTTVTVAGFPDSAGLSEIRKNCVQIRYFEGAESSELANFRDAT